MDASETPKTIINKDHPDAGDGGVVPPESSRWKPGESGNPRGRPPNAGLSILEWMNACSEMSEEEIRKIADDTAVPAAKRAAAKEWLKAIDKTEEAGKSLDRIMDRAMGKPAQAVKVETGTVHIKRATTHKGTGKLDGLFNKKRKKK